MEDAVELRVNIMLSLSFDWPSCRYIILCSGFVPKYSGICLAA